MEGWWRMKAAFTAALLLMASPCLAAGDLGAGLPLISGLPFGGMLLSIALMPLLAPRFWHRHFGKVAAFWGGALALWLVVVHGQAGAFELFHVLVADYVPFLILIYALFTVTGGILVTGRLSGTPLSNTLLLAGGTVLASLIGTTGAAMVLIRPLLRANEWRQKRVHQVVFFIFLVCNVGGSLTPLGDPPLFLGFLHGVPFFWTFSLFAPMALVSALMLAAFYLLDVFHFRREKNAPPVSEEPVRIEGAHNFFLLAIILAAVLASGIVDLGGFTLFGVHLGVSDVLRDFALLATGLASLRTTKKVVREKNGFSWFPIVEVAILFAGIFVTMIPVILILKAGTHGALSFVVRGVSEPAHYFWATGILSSFLDNAPTYLVFLSTALGNFHPGAPEAEAIAALIRENGSYLLAISAGAVFMGANTYIGNAPNFMARSIAEESGVAMPGFFGYIFKYSLLFLVPSFLVVTLVFF